MTRPPTIINIFRLALAAAVIVITVLATMRIEHPVVSGLGDKFHHLAAFYVLALLVDFSAPNSRYGLAKAAPLLAYGLLIEVVQYFLPHRTFSLFDLAADAAGLALYGLSLPLLRRVPVLRRRWETT
ncbi:MAG TPA: VanZ family protein [Acidiferrobacterales bacterium]